MEAVVKTTREEKHEQSLCTPELPKRGAAKDQRNKAPGKRIRGESGERSLHFGSLGNAIDKHSSSHLLEQGASSVALEIEGRARRLILDTGSNVPILQPGVSRSEIKGPRPEMLRSDGGGPEYKRTATCFFRVGRTKIRPPVFIFSPQKRQDFWEWIS